ncbi:zinc-binding dehydrogenase [Modestobacter sp. VKM Ac-2983]|uniref:zinc-binding dehydrogenase n=1 Tax=Modestobacter sp. VKM Ac-2983 TaxID=3004137 RepID=UPI0022ABC57C|nr:zinc-binding dehydrogenase [Modestobacter sp. VKM Ac-2983]MCZ2807554.1 zinc-binding dehydrogenase [Modestobacter sp. VKM Ac-2983]
MLAVASSGAKAEVAQAAGAHGTLPVEGFLGAARELTGGRGVDVIVDPVGGDRFTDSLRSLATEARVVVLGFAGRQIPTVKVNRLLLTDTTVLGAALEEFWQNHPGYVGQQWRELLPLIESGVVDPPISGVYPVSQSTAAKNYQLHAHPSPRLRLSETVRGPI